MVGQKAAPGICGCRSLRGLYFRARLLKLMSNGISALTQANLRLIELFLHPWVPDKLFGTNN